MENGKNCKEDILLNLLVVGKAPVHTDLSTLTDSRILRESYTSASFHYTDYLMHFTCASSLLLNFKCDEGSFVQKNGRFLAKYINHDSSRQQSSFRCLTKIAELVLLIPHHHSNAGEELVFFMVRKTKTAFRPNLDPKETLSSILTIKLDCNEAAYQFQP